MSSRIQLRLRSGGDNREERLGFHLSTFDIPQAATADIDKATCLVTFRFQYPDAEPAGPTQRLSEDISIDVGRNSGKLLAVRINCKRYPSGQVQVQFHRAIAEMDRALGKSSQLLKQHQRENFELVRSVIDANRADVEYALAT